MSKESNPYGSPDYIPPTTSERVATSALRNASQLMAERIVSNAQIEVPEGFMDDYKSHIANDYVPVLVTNHASHADAAASSKLIRLLIDEANTVLPEDNQMEMFTVPLAASLELGQQGGFLRQVYLGAKPVVERAGFVPNLIAREKDKRPIEEGGYGMKDNSRQYIKRHKEALGDKPNGTLIYPEGTTEGGKTDINGVPVGMVPFEEYSIPIHLKLASKHTKRTPMIIYAGIMGSTSAIDPNTKSVSARAIKTFLNPSQYHLRVGGIIETDSPEFEALGTNGELNEFVGKKIAQLLPPEMRGVYA